MGETSQHVTVIMSLPKPNLTSLLYKKTARDFAVALGLAVAGSTVYHFAVKESRRARWNEWLSTYNAEADFNRMMRAGVFQGVNRAIEEGTMTKDYQWIEVEED